MEDVLLSNEDYSNSVDMRSAQILKLSLEIFPNQLNARHMSAKRRFEGITLVSAVPWCHGDNQSAGHVLALL